jgi:hypothetical protein
MTKKEKKERKLNSINIFESKKVEQWKKQDVFKEITSFEWVELKSTY